MSVSEHLIKIFHSANSEFVSGEEIARTLGLSRTAVWHHIEKLKEEGYSFEAVSRRGYRLVDIPDKLLPEEIAFQLSTRMIGKTLFSYPSVKSTNDIAYRMAMDGASEGTVVLAEYQEKGRGRMHREWIAPKGKNILVSLILRPEIEPLFTPLMTVMSSVAVAETLMEMTELSCEIKWPNDVLVHGKKVSGILLEQKSELDNIDFVVIGIGINVNMSKQDFTPELRDHASSVMIESGKKIDRIAFTKKLLSIIEKKYIMIMEKKYDDIMREWIDLSVTFGKKVVVRQEKKTIQGEAVGIEPNGSLLVKDKDGEIHTILSGDVIIQ